MLQIKKAVKILCFVFAAMLMINTFTLEVNAAESAVSENEEIEQMEAVIIKKTNESGNPNARTFLVNCIISISNSSDGMLVEFITDATQTASVLGVKDIKIQKKVWYGWKTVATSSGAESQNAGSFGCHVLYTGAELGETYRVSCVHYGTVDSYTEVENQTEGFIFTY
ncbi:MAG: hypothetical protein J6A94_00870 [Lachnospiraceae bacterium]|nr:hypothetical protein [Lachnospiraceae bacterium]